MPLYEYQCTECGHLTELLQRHGDPPLDCCPQCGAAVRKLFSAPAVQFKGSGWYVTDYAGKGKKPAAGKEAAGSEKDAKKTAGEASGAGKKSDAKSAGSQE